MGLPWIAVGLLWDCSGIPVGLLWACCGTAVGLLRACCETAVRLLWDCHGIAVRLLWGCCGNGRLGKTFSTIFCISRIVFLFCGHMLSLLHQCLTLLLF